MDQKGEVIAEPEGRSVKAFEQMLETVLGYEEARKKASSGDRGAKIDEVLYRVELGKVDLDEARESLKDLGELSEKQTKWLQALEIEAEVKGILDALDPRDRNSFIEGGKKCYEMFKAGRIPRAGTRVELYFWALILEYAETEKDAETMETALSRLRKHEAVNKRYLERKEKALEKIKSEKKEK